MTSSAPDPDWPLFADATPPGFSTASQIEELRREIDLRRQGYPGLVAKGKITREEMDRQIDLFVAIASEIATGDVDDGRFTWADKIHGLRREINLRRATYPRRVEKGRLTVEDAQRHRAILEAVHLRYYVRGFGYRTDGADRALLNAFVAERLTVARRVFPDDRDPLDPALRAAFDAGAWSPLRRSPGITSEIVATDYGRWWYEDAALADIAAQLRDLYTVETRALIDAGLPVPGAWGDRRHRALVAMAEDWRQIAAGARSPRPTTSTRPDRVMVLIDALARLEHRIAGPDGAGPRGDAYREGRLALACLIEMERHDVVVARLSALPDSFVAIA